MSRGREKDGRRRGIGKAMNKIIIDGTAYKVTESLGFQCGVLAKFVETPYGERLL
jgi:hypothetical protein